MNSHNHRWLYDDAALAQRLSLLDCFLDTTNHVERLFWQIIVLTSTNAFEALDCFLEGYIFTWRTGKDFRYVEWL